MGISLLSFEMIIPPKREMFKGYILGSYCAKVSRVGANEMIDDPNKIRGITISSSTAASLTSLGLPYSYQAFPLPKPTPVEIAPPEHPIYGVVGRVASGWAHLEHALDLIIWDLAGAPPEKVACITAQINGATPRYRAVVLLLRQRNHNNLNKLSEKAKELMQKTFDPTEKRNRIVHDPWYVITDQKLTAQFKAMPSKDSRFGIYQVDAEEIESVIEVARKLTDQVHNLRSEIQAVLSTLP
jgi:hypothetical protein